ncbi:4Fe-4S binding protein [Halobacillus amylolyticus]|uniref:4Fe-4S binding protein n=1 Tax=Halobacillus amylolyticus TaxID=2932259 RepID=A0ABY4H6B4_9BACI|nr:4Fe-4S binding protein [Halobacillus amylolyticus]UOR10244.1 4Fe-4S binding protein [Halobacillus amylolyticus]
MNCLFSVPGISVVEEGLDQFLIDPNICIDCGACVAACR